MTKKCILFHFLMLVLVNSAWSSDMDEATMETILNKKDTTVIVYFMRFSTLTRMPVTKERMREIYHEGKLLIRNKAVNRMKELIFAALQVEDDDSKYENARLLIDVISDDVIVYSLVLPTRVGVVDKQIIFDAFYSLLGLYPSDHQSSP